MLATRSSRAYLVLHVDNITKGWDDWHAKWPLICYMPAGEVLYYELGENIHAAPRPIYEGAVDLAEYWRRKLGGRFVRQRSWYRFPVFHVAGKTLDLLKKVRG